jgi:hypothetical protein
LSACFSEWVYFSFAGISVSKRINLVNIQIEEKRKRKPKHTGSDEPNRALSIATVGW